MSKIAIDPTSSIPAFYSEKSIFITGGSGFLGKVLLEKLLRSCRNIREIFLLIRSKKNMNAHERLQRLLEDPLFDKVRKEQPACFDKLIPVVGDISVKGLGLSAADEEVLVERTSIIFHLAANVRFDITLHDAVFANLRSTRDICVLAERMKNLVALVHVSSAFTQPDKFVVDEIVCPIDIDWRKTIRMAEVVDKHILETFMMKYIATMANHYIFTKRLAEQVISDYSGSLPCVICRPSIISPTIREPVKGWLDNFNGQVGLLIGSGKGVLKLLHADPSSCDNNIPIDVVVKTMILAAWKRATNITFSSGKDTGARNNLPFVYNCSSFHSTNMSRSKIKKFGFNIIAEFPLEDMISIPAMYIVKSPFLYHILVILFHFIPALLIDGLLRLSGRRPRLLQLQRKILATNMAVAYFLLNEWDFQNSRMLSLLDELPANDKREFDFATDMYYDKVTYFKNCIIGSKIFLLHESMDRLDKAKRHYKRILWVERIARALLVILLMWICYRIVA